MKRRLVLSTAIAFTVGAFASRAHACKPGMDDRVDVHPGPTVPLPTNGRVILDVFPGLLLGEFDNIVSDVEAHHPQLSTDRERVALRIVEKYPHGAGTKLILSAEHPLRPGTVYVLVFDPPFAGVRRTWTTAASADREAPRWLSRPTAEPPVYRSQLCFTESFVEINVALAETVTIRIDARGHGDRRRQQHVFIPTDGRIRVPLPAGERYSLQLTAVDLAGNESKAPGGPIDVSMPSPEVAKRK